MSNENDSGIRVEIGLRGAMLAKAALDLLGASPRMARLHLVDVAKQMRELDDFLTKRGF